jgi:hypothetical protein
MNVNCHERELPFLVPGSMFRVRVRGSGSRFTFRFRFGVPNGRTRKVGISRSDMTGHGGGYASRCHGTPNMNVNHEHEPEL